MPEAADLLDRARRAAAQEYRKYIHEVAEEIVKDGSADVEDAIHQAADSSWYTTYFNASVLCILASDNEDAIFEEDLFQSSEVDGVHKALSLIAYGAIEADLREEIERLRRE